MQKKIEEIAANISRVSGSFPDNMVVTPYGDVRTPRGTYLGTVAAGTAWRQVYAAVAAVLQAQENSAVEAAEERRAIESSAESGHGDMVEAIRQSAPEPEEEIFYE